MGLWIQMVILILSTSQAFCTGNVQTLSPMLRPAENALTVEALLHQAANCQLLNGHFENAITLLEILPESSENLAWAYFQSGHVEKAFALVKDHPAARAQLHALNFDYDAAMMDMNAAIELDPENAELYLIRGQIRMLLYEWDAILEDYNTALALNPNYADAYYARGVLYYTVAGVGNSDVIQLKQDAIADFERYLELAPNGLHAAEAAQYIEQIQGELDALER